MIKNLASLYIYDLNVKLILLGDVHTDVDAACEGVNIDDLLKQWMIYNEHFKIRTDLLAEVNFTKMNQRHRVGGSPLELLPHNIPCFTKDKNCYQFINFHYVNIRAIEIDDQVINLDPFNMYRVKYEALNNNITSYQIIDIMNTIKKEGMKLIRFMLGPFNFNMIDDFLKLNKGYANVFNQINKYAVIRNGKRMFRAAAELQKLDKSLATAITVFIFKKANLYLSALDLQEEIQVIEMMGYDHNSDIVDAVLTSVDNKLLPLGAFIMDAYTLARMFYYMKNSEEMIVYAGKSHISLYVEFLNTLNYTPLLGMDSHDRCIYDDQLFLYLDINKYMNI